tara:strand:- start:4159 stop:5226 length:1068 start_codon:yes stop_codon:yes gene_type:complete
MENNFLSSYEKILVTGGLGFIGGALISNLLDNTQAKIFNLDKFGYASDSKRLKDKISILNLSKDRYTYIKADLYNKSYIEEVIAEINPDCIFHLAAESHVDKSIISPEKFIQSNVVGTFNLLESIRNNWSNMSQSKKNIFRFLHVSTDEVFGSLDFSGLFSETSAYCPRSPYSASKAASDHMVDAYFHTFGLPVLVTNCSNNYGPWQYPEKFIPLIISKCLDSKDIPIYGDGQNIRDWIYVEDHIDALLLVMSSGEIGNHYCIGSSEEHTNLEIASVICSCLDDLIPENAPHSSLISFVEDRLGHDRRYAIDSSKIKQELGWSPKYSFPVGIKETINWYYSNQNWVNSFAESKPD